MAENEELVAEDYYQRALGFGGVVSGLLSQIQKSPQADTKTVQTVIELRAQLNREQAKIEKWWQEVVRNNEMRGDALVFPVPLSAFARLHEVTRALYASSVGPSLEDKTVAAFEVNRSELQAGLSAHVEQAKSMLGWLAAAGVFGALAVVGVFFCASPPNLAGVAFQPAILELVAHLAGRFSILIGVGWVLVFVGRLHSQHNQQAVSYRDRLVALDASAVVMHYGATDSKERTLVALIESFVSQETNAFRPAEIKKHNVSVQVEDALKVTDPVLNRVRATLKGNSVIRKMATDS